MWASNVANYMTREIKRLSHNNGKNITLNSPLYVNCGAREDSESPVDCKIKPVHPKGNQPEYSLEG